MAKEPEASGTQAENSQQSPRQSKLDELLEPLSEDSRKALREYFANREAITTRFRSRITELEPKAKAFEEYEEASKTAEQKANDAIRKAQAERDDAHKKLLRYEVASDFPGLQASDAAFLTGESREELEDSAQRLLARIQAAERPKTPKPDQGQGREQSNDNGNPEAWLRSSLRHGR